MLVIADTGPVNYLVLVGHIEILPPLFGKVILPSVVRDELTDAGTPLIVQNWIAHPPAWVDVRLTTSDPDAVGLARNTGKTHGSRPPSRDRPGAGMAAGPVGVWSKYSNLLKRWIVAPPLPTAFGRR